MIILASSALQPFAQRTWPEIIMVSDIKGRSKVLYLGEIRGYPKPAQT